MKVIITGATGSLGAYLTRWFSAKGHEVIAQGRIARPPAQLLACSTYIQADITKSIQLPEADVCVHCAGLADDHADPAELFNANVLGTQNILMASRHIRTGIYVSSSSVYAHGDEPLREDMAESGNTTQLSNYGKSKLLAEGRVAHHGHESCFILRPRAIYGAGDKVLLPRLLKLVRKGQMVCVGDMNVKLSLTHFANFAMAVEACMHSGAAGTHTYNVSDDSVYVLYDVVRKLVNTLCGGQTRERKLPLWIFALLSNLEFGDYTPLLLNTVSRNLVLDIGKIRRELNYAPTMNLDRSLEEIHGWVNAIGGIGVLRKAEPALAWMH